LTTSFAQAGPAEAMCRRLETAGFRLLALSPGGETTLADVAPAPRTAVLFGAEGPGLPPQLLRRAQTVRIPMAAAFDSLNVATASGIVLHQLAGARLRRG
jgi:tRNA G18 (ribose-2'-O)-methylase SpoU